MSRWLIDPDHTQATFVVRHMMIADVHGHLGRISGELIYAPDDPGSMTLEAVIEAETICTGIAKRDDHLRSADFFDVAHHPHIIFKSTRVRLEGAEPRQLHGELALHGVTRPVVLEVQRFGPVTSSEGETSVGLRLNTTLDRRDFGMNWNVPLPAGLMVGTEVRVVIEIEADLAEV